MEEDLKTVTFDLIDNKVTFKRYNEDKFTVDIDETQVELKKIADRLKEINGIF